MLWAARNSWYVPSEERGASIPLRYWVFAPLVVLFGLLVALERLVTWRSEGFLITGLSVHLQKMLAAAPGRARTDVIAQFKQPEGPTWLHRVIDGFMMNFPSMQALRSRDRILGEALMQAISKVPSASGYAPVCIAVVEGNVRVVVQAMKASGRDCVAVPIEYFGSGAEYALEWADRYTDVLAQLLLPDASMENAIRRTYADIVVLSSDYVSDARMEEFAKAATIALQKSNNGACIVEGNRVSADNYLLRLFGWGIIHRKKGQLKQLLGRSQLRNVSGTADKRYHLGTVLVGQK